MGSDAERQPGFAGVMVESMPNGTALEQLKAKAYAEKYRGQGWPITLIGVEFSRDSRNIVGFEIEAA